MKENDREACREAAQLYPFGQLSEQAMLSQDILGVDIIFQEFISQGVMFRCVPGHVTSYGLSQS
jgi:hypothetical protein